MKIGYIIEGPDGKPMFIEDPKGNLRIYVHKKKTRVSD